MSLKSSRVVVALIALVSIVSILGCTQAVKSDTAQKRTSFDTFTRDIEKFPLNDVPFSKVEVGELAGRRVSGDAAIMKRFGGQVEFDGSFQGILTGDFRLATPKEGEQIKKPEKIDITLAWPSGTSSNIYWKLHLYPKAGSLKSWRALKPKTSIKFRAVVTGITMYHPWIPGLERAYSILLEDGEIVSE